MPSSIGSQVPSKDFSYENFQSIIDHIEGQWRGVLPDLVCMVVHSIATIRSKCRNITRVTPRLLVSGIERNDETNFSGVHPLPHELRGVENAFKTGIELGVIIEDDAGETHIDLSVTALDLAQHERVIKSIINANRHNPKLRTENGVMLWLMQRAEWLLRDKHAEPAAEVESAPLEISDDTTDQWEKPNSEKRQIPLGNRLGSYSYFYRTVSSKDKSFSDIRAKGWLMSKVDELRDRLLASVAARQGKVADKRKKRGTLPDLCKLFEAGWTAGQREASPGTPATRIVASRDIALLKSQIIIPFRDANLDVEEFSKWVTLNWGGIGATYFAKTKQYPHEPAFRWLVRCLETYTKAFMERDTIELGAAIDYSAVAAKAKRADAATKDFGKVAEALETKVALLAEENRQLKKRKILRAPSVSLPDWEDDE
jgi:hypothetical protein